MRDLDPTRMLNEINSLTSSVLLLDGQDSPPEFSETPKVKERLGRRTPYSLCTSFRLSGTRGVGSSRKQSVHSGSMYSLKSVLVVTTTGVCVLVIYEQ